MFSHYLETKFDNDLVTAQDKISKNLVGSVQYKISKSIIEYVIENNLVLSDVESFLSDEDIKPSKVLNIIGFNIFVHANNISNLIARLNIYVLLYTNVKNRDFTIMVDKLPYINLYNMRINIIDTSKVLIYYPVELELVQIYKKLYSPNNFSEWETCNKQRKELESIVSGRGVYYKLSSLGKKMEAIILKMAKNRDAILVGTFAAAVKLRVQSTLPIQVISSDVFMNQAISELESQFPNVQIKTYDVSIYVMPELRLVKTNVVIKGELVASFFNNITYELVPFEVVGGNKIADVYVILCHLMIDYYTYKKNGMNDYANACFKYFELLDKVGPIELPQYLGVYSDLNIYRRKKGTYNEYEPYNPENVRFNTGSYRTIQIREQR